MDQTEEDEPLAEKLMKRGEFLRQLREMELADQAERDQTAAQEQSSLGADEEVIHVLPNFKRVLEYDSYLVHQRYHDDLKHVDCHFIEYVYQSSNEGGRIIMEQDKSLGKGGLCWDAAFILAEHLIQNQHEWNAIHNKTTTFIVELGSGTGLCGIMIAKAVVDCHVRVTDLVELLPNMMRNVNRNFDSSRIFNGNKIDKSFQCHTNIEDEELLHELLASREESATNTTSSIDTMDCTPGTISANVLKWGDTQDYRQTYDVVLGADVVASLYDPIALAETMHALCHDKSIVYVSYKGRLTGPHEQFEERLGTLFENIERIRPDSRNKNPQVWILRATGKK